MSHGGLKRARSWKQRIQPKEAYSSPGLLYSEATSSTATVEKKTPTNEKGMQIKHGSSRMTGNSSLNPVREGLPDNTPGIRCNGAVPKWVDLSNSDLSSHAIDQLLGIVADPSLKHSLDVLDLVNSL